MPFAKANFAISTFKPASSWWNILISHAFLPGTVVRGLRITELSGNKSLFFINNKNEAYSCDAPTLLTKSTKHKFERPI